MSIRPLWFKGWSFYTTWGYDDLTQEWYAQLYRDDDPDRGDGPPLVWIRNATSIEDLGHQIAAAIEIPEQSVISMMRAPEGGPEEDRFAREAQS